MSAELQPSTQFAMVVQEYTGRIPAHDQRASGKMRRESLAAEASGTMTQEVNHSVPMRLFLRAVRKIKVQ
jgi:hypothetical protein